MSRHLLPPFLAYPNLIHASMNQSVGAGGEGASGSAANAILRAIRQTNVSGNERTAHISACRIKGHCLDLARLRRIGTAFGKMDAKLPTLESPHRAELSLHPLPSTPPGPVQTYVSA